MMALICVIVRLGGITVSLHWGGRFGVRESGEPIPAHLWVMVKITTLEAVDTKGGLPGKALHFLNLPPAPTALCEAVSR